MSYSRTLTKYDLADKPRSIYNMDESGIQINNKPGKVIAQKGSKCVHVLTSKEKGENVSVIACANAEGTFLPPILILKGVRKNESALEGMPSGSDIYMNRKSSFITAELFLKWLKEVFVPRKPDGPVILILDGHSSHCSNVEMLDYAERNNVILLCLPSHTTQALQPLDRSFFKPFKDYYKKEADRYMFTTKERDINRKIVGKLIGPAWEKAATIKNSTSGFLATGIYPFNPDNIPDYFFEISDNSQNLINTDQNLQPEEAGPQLEDNESQLEESFFRDDNNYIFIFDDGVNVEANRDNITDNNGNNTEELNLEEEMEEAKKLFRGTHLVGSENSKKKPIEKASTSKDIGFNTNKEGIKETPTKYLNIIAPVPTISSQQNKRKQSAKVLTSNGIKQKGKKAKLNSENSNKKKGKKLMTENDKINIHDRNTDDDVNCCECLENYFLTMESVDWIKCIDCQQWLHETCTMYGDRCNSCGRTTKRQINSEKVTKKLME